LSRKDREPDDPTQSERATKSERTAPDPVLREPRGREKTTSTESPSGFTPSGPANRLLGAVAPLMRSLMEAVDIEEEIPRSLEVLGEKLELTAIALFEGETADGHDVAAMQLRHSWVNEHGAGIRLPEQLSTYEVFGGQRWTIQPRSMLIEKEAVETGPFCHRTYVPILRGGVLVACLGIFTEAGTRHFSNYESSLLSALASSFGGALLRQRAQQHAIQSELRYQRLFERNLAGVYRTTVDGRFLEANDALARLLGIENREQLLACSVYDFYPDRLVRDQEIADLERHGSVSSREVQLERPDGTPVWVLVNEALVDESVIEGTLIDISDRKTAERRALRSEKLQSLGVLAGGIAHDFNNLLTSVLGNVSLARELVEGENPLAPVLERIEGATLRAQDMAGQLLTFARGGQPIKRSVDVVESVQDAVHFALTGAGTRCDIELSENIGRIRVDIGQWNQVLCNLLINANQAMGGSGTIRVHGERCPDPQGGEQVHLIVEDDGPGIDPKIVDQIFDPFFTTKPEGSGLGLATCHSVLERHGGRIDVELPELGGTRFHIWIPASTKEDVEPAPPAKDRVAFAGRLLLLDDRPDVREIGEAMLGHLGFEVDSFAEGSEAVAAYRAALDAGEHYDGLIMDLTIPGGMGGVEALQKIREMDPDVVAFVSSGYSNDPVMGNYEAAGFIGVIEKPYRLSDLREVLFPVFGKAE
jgi:PAS domain S-box-containing protein